MNVAVAWQLELADQIDLAVFAAGGEPNARARILETHDDDEDVSAAGGNVIDFAAAVGGRVIKAG